MKLGSASKIALLFGIAWGIAMGAHAADVSIESLLNEMVNLEALASLPDPPYTCRQFSSYDRRSTDPSVLTDDNWFANADRGQFLRVLNPDTDRAEYVMMDVAGPGAIVRIWSANPKDAGIVRVYLDGVDTPALEAALTDLLDGEHAPFVAPIAHIAASGWNSYLPIPYARHCLVTASQPDFYYHINYRTYPEGTSVRSFTMSEAANIERLIGRTASALHDPQSLPLPAGLSATPYDTTLDSEQSLVIDGPAAIHRITCTIAAGNLEKALRGCLLTVTFDGAATPQVQTPLGDFFGSAPGLNPYASIALGMQSGGRMYSNWVMPFQKQAAITLVNRSGTPVKVSGEIFTAPYAWTENSCYFHAKWRAQRAIPTQPRQDWSFLQAKGRGRFVGDMLHITNPVEQWWGEGDEKIYVGDEPFPSHFGTGSEDYFGYAWGSAERFTHAYHNQTRVDGPGTYGHVSVNRFHILDNIPFTTSFRFDMEIWHWADVKVDMEAISYWYAAPDATDFFTPPLEADLIVVPPPPRPQPKRVEGAIEGEDLKIIQTNGGIAEDQAIAGIGWSGDRQLWWRDAAPGDWLAVEFNAENSGMYEVLGNFTRAIDYGIMRISINGKRAAGPMDFFANTLATTGETSLGAFSLDKGANVMKITVVGANPNASPPRNMFGLDYLRLVATQ